MNLRMELKAKWDYQNNLNFVFYTHFNNFSLLRKTDTFDIVIQFCWKLIYVSFKLKFLNYYFINLRFLVIYVSYVTPITNLQICY